MLELLIAGGWVMWPILICSAIALAIILERFWTLRRSTVLPPRLGEEVRAWAGSQQIDDAHVDSLKQNSPLGEVLANPALEAARERGERHVELARAIDWVNAGDVRPVKAPQPKPPPGNPI